MIMKTFLRRKIVTCIMILLLVLAVISSQYAAAKSPAQAASRAAVRKIAKVKPSQLKRFGPLHIFKKDIPQSQASGKRKKGWAYHESPTKGGTRGSRQVIIERPIQRNFRKTYPLQKKVVRLVKEVQACLRFIIT